MICGTPIPNADQTLSLICLGPRGVRHQDLGLCRCQGGIRCRPSSGSPSSACPTRDSRFANRVAQAACARDAGLHRAYDAMLPGIAARLGGARNRVESATIPDRLRLASAAGTPRSMMLGCSNVSRASTSRRSKSFTVVARIRPASDEGPGYPRLR